MCDCLCKCSKKCSKIEKSVIFSEKKIEKVLWFRKKPYLCTRFRDGTTVTPKRRRSLTTFHTDKAVQRVFVDNNLQS